MELVGNEDLKFLRHGCLYPDVDLKIQNTTIPCNKSILSSQSLFFEAIFSLPFKEKNLDVIEIKGEIDARTMEGIIHFMYKGALRISWRSLPDIVHACAFLQLTELLEICDKYLADKYLHKDNCILCFCFARKYNLQKLMETARRCIVKEFMDLILHDDFLKMDETELITIIRDDQLYVPNEDYVLDAILRWTHFDVEERDRHFAKLASFVRFSYCTLRNELLLMAESQEFFNPRESFKKLITIGKTKISYNSHFHSVWKDLTDLPDDRLVNFSACSTPNGIIITGGAHTPYNIRAVSYLFDFKEWKNLPPMTYPRYHHRAVFHDNAVYVIGGLDSNHTKLSAVEKYHHSGKWIGVSPMETGIFRPVVVSFDGAIFVFSLSKLFKYNSQTNEWETKKKGVPYKWPFLCDAVPFKNNIYVIGVADMWGQTFWAYQPASDQWEILRSPMLMHLRASAFVWQGKIMVGGGTQTDEIEMYYTETKQWSVWNLSLPRFQKTKYQIFCTDF